MFGERFDSLGTVLERVLKGEDGSPASHDMSEVDRYLVMLCAIQLCDKVRQEQSEFWSEYGTQADTIQKRLAERTWLRTALCAGDLKEMPAFMDWFDKWFLRRAEPVGQA
jgi:hypothetical protein